MKASQTRMQPLDYRQEEVGRIMERWRATESCSLVGVGSVGKSNLMQHLANPVVQQAYMKETHVGQFGAIIIDPSMLGPLPADSDEQIACWIGYELMMHRMFMAFHQSELLDAKEMSRFVEIYETLQDGSNPLYAYMGLRYFELGLDLLMSKGIQIVFMFDEFEEMLKSLPIKFFLTLRGLRDSNKKQLSYLTFTRVPLMAVAEQESIDLLKIEEFMELFTDNVFYIGPYNNRDAHRMVDDLCRRNNRVYEEYVKNFLVWATGGFAGLLRASFRMLESFSDLNLTVVMTDGPALAEELSRKQPVQMECKTIWNSLSMAERQVLEVASGKLASFKRDVEADQAAEYLVRKKLLRSEGNLLTIHPPVFHYFVKEYGGG
ncbi:MAG: hypothetical protein K8J31_26935 [Anaerolineae bacterium]|nr:hypothetical protein [Anaerolineae bacterium]